MADQLIRNNIESLKSHLAIHRDKYLLAQPYPHVVIDDFFDNDYAIQLSNDIKHNKFKNEKDWDFFEHKNTRRWRLEDDSKMPNSLKNLAWFVNSRSFLLFIEEITGLQSLIGDPYFIGGGAMASDQGGFLNMHVDFNWHHKLQLWRQCNFIVYLTQDWREQWGGDLKIKHQDSDCTKIISPKFNRAVIFQVDDKSYHGQPDPINCPDSIQRFLFSSFYYSTKRPSDTSEDPHFTKYSLENSDSAKSLTLS